MSTCYLLTFLLLLPLLADSSCSPYNFSCGNYTIGIDYPFYSAADPDCGGLHFVRCMNLVPLVRFHGEGFVYPVSNISYPDRTVVIHDLKLSAYFRGSSCVFLYDFVSPVPHFNVSDVTERLSSGQGFFGCEASGYDSSHDVFRWLYNLTACDDYGLDYSYGFDDQSVVGVPSHCATSSDVWFDWRLSFDADDGGVSLLSAGFSRKWTSFPDCFACHIEAGDCSNQCLKPSDSRSSKKVIIGVSCGLGGFLIACGICFYCYKRKMRKHRLSPAAASHSAGKFSSNSRSKRDAGSISFHSQTPLFSYEELVEATNGFDPSRELGDGGYGVVFEGNLRDGRVVAVKRLYETSYKRVEQFMNEVEILSRLRHPNLVTLYGSTSPNSPHLLLVYEYVPNGTLADHLHDPLRSRSLPLSTRLSMAIGTASALSYLHSVDVIHRDVKTQNILVDSNFVVKVADFGLSRLFPANATHVSTAPQGTPGYLDPEYHRFFQLTDKSDVFSFGVVLMELIASRPAVDTGRAPNEISLAMAATSMIQKGELGRLVDPGLGYGAGGEANRIVTGMAELAFRCLQMDREMRPSIKEVLEGLREIERGGGGRGGVGAKEETMPLKHSGPFSPDSVMNGWLISRSTTPNTSA